MGNKHLLHDFLPSLATGALKSQATVRAEFQKILDDQFQVVSKRSSWPQVVDVWYNGDFSSGEREYERTRRSMETRERWWTPRVPPGTHRARDSDLAGMFWRAAGWYWGATRRTRREEKPEHPPSMVYPMDPEESRSESDATGSAQAGPRRSPPPQGATLLPCTELRAKAAQKTEEHKGRKARALEASECIELQPEPVGPDWPQNPRAQLPPGETWPLQTIWTSPLELKYVDKSSDSDTAFKEVPETRDFSHTPDDDIAGSTEAAEGEDEIAPGSCRPLSKSVNEVRLWHGTKLASLLPILRKGFDATLASSGLYGKGIYLASQACKSYQYTETEYSGFLGKDYDSFLLYNRVLLGPRPYLVQDEDMAPGGAVERDWRGWFWRTGPESVQRRLPRGSDSWIVTPGTRRNHSTQRHEEYVVPSGAQVYPEYVVEVAWQNDALRAIPGQIAVGCLVGCGCCCLRVATCAAWLYCLLRSK